MYSSPSSALTGALLLLVASTGIVSAQTSTSCNPTTNTTCSPDPGLNVSTFSTDFTQGSQHDSWVVADYTNVTFSGSSEGAVFTIDKAADAPTITSDFYIFFGYVEVKMKAAPGTGIVSSIVLLSDDLDEVDYEFLGGTDTVVQSNFFGKGNTTTYNREVDLSVSGSTTAAYHTYALNWTAESLSWIVDGQTARTLHYADAVALGGKNYPQTPCRVKLGAWAGGASSSPGTVTWAGGKTDFSQAPFNMYVESVVVNNYNPAGEYTYGDQSGSYESIKFSGSSNGTSSTTTTTTGNGLGSVSGSGAAASGSSTVVATATTMTPSSSTATATATKTSSSPVSTYSNSGSSGASSKNPTLALLMAVCVMIML